MKPEVIKNYTRILNKPADWNEESMGQCGALAVRDEFNRIREMASAWTPSPEELAQLNRGGAVILRIVGAVHPPVSVSVED